MNERNERRRLRSLWRGGLGSALVGIAGCACFVACGGGSSGGTGAGGGDDTSEDAGDSSVAMNGDDGPTVSPLPDSSMVTPDGGSMPDGAPAPTFTVGGEVTGLVGEGLVLENNAGDDLMVAAPTTAGGTAPFTFSTSIASGKMYAVSVKAQPNTPTQTCTVTTGTGAGTISANVSNVAITCAIDDFSVGLTLHGLAPAPDAGVSDGGADAGDAGDAGDAATDAGDAGDGGDGSASYPDDALILSDNGGDILALSSDGMYKFGTQIPSGQMFDVEIVRQPVYPEQTCSLMGNSGTVMGGDISSLTVNCTTDAFNLGGTANSTLKGTGLVLSDGLGDTATVNTTTFAFSNLLPSGSTYNVTVMTPPSNPTQACTVTNPHGTITHADVNNLAIACTTSSYSVSYDVTGLAGTGLVLTDTIGTATTPTDTTAAITANGTVAFPTKVTSGVAYSVKVKTNPTNPSQTCTFGAGTITNADVTVPVTCTTNTQAVSGTVATLANGAVLKVTNNGADEQTVTGTMAASLPFAFGTKVASGQTYALAISAQPTGQFCTFANGSGKITTADVTNLAVTCRAKESIAVVYADANSADVIATLTGTSAFSAVTGIDASSATGATPTVAALQAYTAVLVYSSAPFKDPAALGNNLGSYLSTPLVTGGTTYGRVVGATQINTTANAIGGTFASTYFTLKVGGAATGPSGLNVIDVPASALVQDVSTLSATVAIRGIAGTQITGTAKIVEWGDGNAIATTGTYKVGTVSFNRADLNFFPVSSKVNANYWTGDGAALLRNALLYR